MSPYHEPRVDISLDVKVWGMDLYGKPFVQHARTVNASSVGARSSGLTAYAKAKSFHFSMKIRKRAAR